MDKTKISEWLQENVSFTLPRWVLVAAGALALVLVMIALD